MNPYQEEAKKLEEKMREAGYLSTDVVYVAYFLLQGNLEKAEVFKQKNAELDELIKRAEELMKS